MGFLAVPDMDYRVIVSVWTFQSLDFSGFGRKYRIPGKTDQIDISL
jgi:hypothetical protein